MPRDQFYDVGFKVGTGGTVTAVATTRATVYLAGTLTIASIYTAEVGGTPQVNPWIPGDGIVIFWADSGNYDVKIEDTAGTPAFTTRTIRFSAVSGGTAGITTTQLPTITATQLDATTVTNKLWSAGDLKASAATSPQAGWLLCNGQSVSRTTYADLFAVVGTTWGSADGSSFNVPDLRGRTLIGVGTGSGLTARAMADSGGVETHALTEAELASHTHTFQGESGGGAGGLVAPKFEADKALDATFWDTDAAGSGTAHQNMPPFKAVNYFIKV